MLQLPGGRLLRSGTYRPAHQFMCRRLVLGFELLPSCLIRNRCTSTQGFDSHCGRRRCRGEAFLTARCFHGHTGAASKHIQDEKGSDAVLIGTIIRRSKQIWQAGVVWRTSCTVPSDGAWIRLAIHVCCPAFSTTPSESFMRCSCCQQSRSERHACNIEGIAYVTWSNSFFSLSESKIGRVALADISTDMICVFHWMCLGCPIMASLSG